ncbi:polyprenol phosphomannose-dependent alpha 1,6 mannosyltransferase MptB [Parenemella sanctibonifatiensis]|uniref:polyprenol phosphomannose-dependent alpha 1,6 mannosyltransferase MptB n=1 Tax=Parenemella sanctibonifatiensis TaxID=2016505 RepID=UPI00226CCE63|nr:polyprenol phosphomannose-dependent alpha 1,6 mannosyltransferase MptB [Parenemella sanctibonifatiensis]
MRSRERDRACLRTPGRSATLSATHRRLRRTVSVTTADAATQHPTGARAQWAGGLVRTLKATLRVRAVVIGLIGSTLLAAATFALAWVPPRIVQEVWLLHVARTRTGRELSEAMAIFGVMAMAYAWLRIRPQVEPHIRHHVVAILWSLPMLAVPPMLSRDAYAYTDQGWILHLGFNPYVTPMGTLPGPYWQLVDGIWAGTTTVYPPLALALQALVITITGFVPMLGVYGMRLPTIGAVILMAVFLPKLARKVGVSPQIALWAAVVNPLTLIHFIGGAHNDAGMVGVMVLALWAATKRWGLVTGAILIGCAVAIKQPAALAGVGVVMLALPKDIKAWTAAKRWGRIVWTSLVGGAIALATFLLITVATGLDLGWLTGSGAPSAVDTMAPLNMAAVTLEKAAGVANLGDYDFRPIFEFIGTAAMVVLIGYWFFKYSWKKPLHFVCYSLLAVALLGPSLQAWYVLWGLPLLTLTKPSRLLTRLSMSLVLYLLLVSVLNEYLKYTVISSSVISLVPAVLLYFWSDRLTKSRVEHHTSTLGNI